MMLPNTSFLVSITKEENSCSIIHNPLLTNPISSLLYLVHQGIGTSTI